MSKVYHLKNGQLALHPDSRSEAVRVRDRFYLAEKRCEKCNCSSLRFTTTNSCIMCQRYKIELTRYYVRNGLNGWPSHVPESLGTNEILKEVLAMRELLISDDGYRLLGEPCRTHGHVHISNTSSGDCYQCSLSRSEQDRAANNGEHDYVPTGKCSGCNEVTLRDTVTRQCTECGYTPVAGRTANSPRQEALKAGETWYTPLTQCKKCGEVAPRNVHNGKCKNCDVDEDNARTETPDVVMMRENPDMIVSRDDARNYGMKVYLTGNACRKGHTGWRYVSTGNCISCIRG